MSENKPQDGHVRGGATSETAARYWRANLKLLFTLLLVWFAVSFGAGYYFCRCPQSDQFLWRFRWDFGLRSKALFMSLCC